MTPIDVIKELRALCATATAGKWKVIRPGHGHGAEYRCVQFGRDESYTSLEMLPEDAKFIALLDELDKREKALDVARKALEKVESAWSRQCGRVFESMGTDNPRAQAIDEAVTNGKQALAQIAEILKPE